MPFTPPDPPRFQAFTVRANGGRLRQIVTDVGISLAFKPIGQEVMPERMHNTRGLWDTGATCSAITKSVADALGLQPVGMTMVQHVAGCNEVNIYLVNVYLPNKVAIPGVRVSECVSTEGGFGAIIGMDIITMGDFTITNVGGISKVSYRYPSIKEIDFVREHQMINSLAKPGPKPQRNDLCPCGSGRKYKNCHGIKA